MSKISERGQITLPKKIRGTALFSGARAVVFKQHANAISIVPVKLTPSQAEHISALNATMRDWSDPSNDNLFDFSAP